LDWLNSYLSGRKQFRTVNNCDSEIITINYCGVPQGSVLSPLLFLIYVNDICNAAPEAKIKLFADETKNVFIHGKNKDLVVKQANQFISDLNCWFTANKLSINIDKTCVWNRQNRHRYHSIAR